MRTKQWRFTALSAVLVATLLIALVAALALPLTPTGSVRAQDGDDAPPADDPACNGLSAADCDLLLASNEAMSDLGNFTMPEWSIRLTLFAADERVDFRTRGAGAVVLPADLGLRLDVAGVDGLLADPLALGRFVEDLDAAAIEDLLARTGLELGIDEAMLRVPGELPIEGRAALVLRDGVYLQLPTPAEGDVWFGEPLALTDADRADLETALDDIAAALNDPDLVDAFNLLGALGLPLGEMTPPAGLSVTSREAGATLHGQDMAAFVTTTNLGAILSDPATILQLQELLSDPALGVEPDLQFSLSFGLTVIGQALSDTEVRQIRWVGLDDNLIHYLGVEFDANLALGELGLDLDGLDGPTPGDDVRLRFVFGVELDEHNAVDLDTITAPDDYEPFEALEDVFPDIELDVLDALEIEDTNSPAL